METGFNYETIVTMADGQYLTLEDIKEGDEVLSYDADKKEAVSSKVVSVSEMKAEKAVSVRANEEIICSEEQLFIMADGSKKKAVELRPGDVVLKEDLVGTPIKSVRVVEKPVEMISMKTKKGNFIAEGVFVSN